MKFNFVDVESANIGVAPEWNNRGAHVGTLYIAKGCTHDETRNGHAKVMFVGMVAACSGPLGILVSRIGLLIHSFSIRSYADQYGRHSAYHWRLCCHVRVCPRLCTTLIKGVALDVSLNARLPPFGHSASRYYARASMWDPACSMARHKPCFCLDLRFASSRQ